MNSFCAFLLVALVSVKGLDEKDIVSIDVDDKGSLVVDVSIILKSDERCYIEYEPSRPNPRNEVSRLRSATSDEGKRHDILLYRLLADEEYDFDIYVLSDSSPIYSGSFKTGPADSSVTAKDPEIVYGTPTYSLIHTGRNDPGFDFIFDTAEKPNIVFFSDHRGFPGDAMQLTSDGTVVFLPLSGGVEAVSPDGKTVADVNTDCYLPHHSIDIQQDNERYAWTFGKERLRDFPGGLRDQAVDVILRIDLQDETYEVVFSMADFLDPQKERTKFSDAPSDPEKYFPCIADQDGTVNDWARLNSIQALSGDELLIGSHHLETVFKFEKVNGKWDIKWRLGHENSHFKFLNDEDHFYGQHEVQLLPNDELLVMDNGVGRPQSEGGWFSRGLQLKLDLKNMEVQSGWSYPLEWTQYVDWERFEDRLEEGCVKEDYVLCISGHRGSLQRLDNGNTMVLLTACDCDPTGRGYISELDENGKLVSIMSLDRAGTYLNDVTIIDRIADETEIQGSTGSTKNLPVLVHSCCQPQSEDSESGCQTIATESICSNTKGKCAWECSGLRGMEGQTPHIKVNTSVIISVGVSVVLAVVFISFKKKHSYQTLQTVTDV